MYERTRWLYGLDSQLAEVAHGGGAGVLKLHMEGRVGIEVAHRGGLEYWSLPLASPNTQTYPMPNAVCSAIDVLCRRKWECKQVLSGMGHCWALQCASIAGSLEPCPGCLWGKYPSLSVCAMLYSSCSPISNMKHNITTMQMQCKLNTKCPGTLCNAQTCCTYHLCNFKLHCAREYTCTMCNGVCTMCKGDCKESSMMPFSTITIQKSHNLLDNISLRSTNLAQPGLEI